MPRLSIVLYTLYSYLATIFLVLLFVIPTLILICIPERYRYDNKLIYFFVYSFYFLAQKISFLPIVYKGLENIPDGPVIFAANHQSAFDIPLLGLLAKRTPHIWLARSDVMRNFRLIRPILPRLAVIIDTESPRKSMLSLLRVLSLVSNKNRHVMIFPEGARFTTGTVNDFYGGFVILTRRLNRPLIPVYISGIQKVYPPDSFWMGYGPVTITIGSPMFPHPDETDALFKQRVHQWFLVQVT
jgi:1-acyl-sn-glycerol-3-phosphate acyltransferase